MSRQRYILYQIGEKLLTIWLIITALFFFFRLMPGSYLDLLTLSGASEEFIEAVRAQWGLNEPLYVQYINYMSNLLSGDVGNSLQLGIPVWDMVKIRLWNTIILVAPAVLCGYTIGAIVGTLIGYKRDTPLEKGIIIVTNFFGTIPGFFLGVVFIFVVSGWLNLLPSGGMIDPTIARELRDAAWWRPYATASFWTHYILPFTVITLKMTYFPTLLMRTSVVETRNQPFTYYHRIKGLSEFTRMRHLAKHSIIPLMTIFPVSLVRALSGMVLIEFVFNWPGIGFTLLQAVLARDFPVVQFVFILTAVFIVVGNFVIDILYGYVDPRMSIHS